MKKCAICGKDYDENQVVCPVCMPSTNIRSNYEEWINQVELEYREVFDVNYLMEGLQKDAIQNSWGARIDRRHAKDWGFEFEIIEDKGKTFLILTDKGCFGLTGPDYNTFPPVTLKEELRKHPEYRLARFRTMHYSGDNEQGGGKFGRGKTLYLAASTKRHFFWDSFTYGENEYKAGSTHLAVDELKVSDVITGDRAKKYMTDHVSSKIKPLTTYGTRIVIMEPREELIKAIEDGLLLVSVGDTWWPVIKRGLKISIITKSKQHDAKVPEEFSDLEATDTKVRKMRNHDNVKFEYSKTLCKFKHFRLFVSNKKAVPEEMRGVYLYRRDMKIAQIERLDIHPQIEERFYGYIDIEPGSPLEDYYIFEGVEGLQHASFTTGYRGVLGAIKRCVDEKFRELKKELGLDDAGVRDEQETKETMQRALARFQKQWPELQGIGQGAKIKVEKKLAIELESLRSPHPEGYVNVGEDLTDIVFKITNNHSSDLKVNILIKTIKEDGTLIEDLVKCGADIRSNASFKTKSFGFNVATAKYSLSGFYVACLCESSDNRFKDEYKKYIYIGKPAQPTQNEPVSIRVIPMNFPTPGKYRADFGQKITNIEYKIINNTSLDISAHFRLRAMDNSRSQEIVIEGRDINLKPNGEEIIKRADIEIKADEYRKLLEGGEKGSVILRATVSSLQDFSYNNKKYQRAERLARCDVKFWINCDPGKGIFTNEVSWGGTENGPKSKIEGLEFWLNIDHPEYKYVKKDKDRSRLDDYVNEQICRQVLMLVINENALDKWPVHPTEPGYKNNLKKDNASKEEIVKSFISTLDYMLTVYFK